MSIPILNSVGKLSERAQILIHHMLDVHESAASIARSVSRSTRERISPAAVARHAKTYAAKVQAKENARQRADHLVSAIIRDGADVSDMLIAALRETFAFAKRTGALREMNPLLFEAAERKRRELALKEKRDSREMDLKERQVQVGERRVQVFEQRLRLDRGGAQAAVRKLDRKAKAGESLSIEEVEQIREIYGLPGSSERQPHSRDNQPGGTEREGADAQP